MRHLILTAFLWIVDVLASSNVPDQQQDFTICPTSGSAKYMKCQSDEVITVHDAVFVSLRISDPCSQPNITLDIQNAGYMCKFYENRLDNHFKSCNGETSCRIEPHMAEQKLVHCPGNIMSNILHIKYSCVKILNPDVTTVLLPLTSSRSVEGTSLRIHSPDFPCNTPNKQFNFSCNVTAAAEINKDVNFLLNLKVFVKFPESTNRCQEELYIESSNKTWYCSQPTESRYQNDSLSLNIEHGHGDKLLTFAYSKSSANDGGKSILQVEILNNDREQVGLKISCNNQESLQIGSIVSSYPETSSLLSHGCRPFSMPPSSSTMPSKPSNTTTPLTTTPTLMNTAIHTTEKEMESTSTAFTMTTIAMLRDINSDVDSTTVKQDPSPEESNILIGVLAGLFVAIIIVIIIIIVVVCRKRRAPKSDKEIMTMTNIPSTSAAEPLSFYAVAQTVDETKASSESDSPLNPRQVYAVVSKGKRKDKVMNDESGDIVNDLDVVKRDSGDVIMCENTDLYDTVR